jgi:hypothetical protein
MPIQVQEASKTPNKHGQNRTTPLLINVKTTSTDNREKILKVHGAIKVFHDKQKLKPYMTTKPPLQKILQGILHTKMKANKSMKGQAVPNHRRRKIKESENNTHSAAHNQTFKQQK